MPTLKNKKQKGLKEFPGNQPFSKITPVCRSRRYAVPAPNNMTSAVSKILLHFTNPKNNRIDIIH